MDVVSNAVTSIYWSPHTEAVETYGAIRQYWLEHGAFGGSMGHPKKPEESGGGQDRKQVFQHGTLFWSPGSGIFEQVN
jgi:hypothetical protein